MVLKKFPAAGKTGTAYDFTDALFAGYDSTLTCAVWAGLTSPKNLPRRLRRRAPLPVWVDVMNASLARYAPRPFRRPARPCTRSRICSKSGLLATDKCYEDVRESERAMSVKASRQLRRTGD